MTRLQHGILSWVASAVVLTLVLAVGPHWQGSEREKERWND